MNAFLPLPPNSSLHSLFYSKDTTLEGKVQQVVDFLFFQKRTLLGALDLNLAKHVFVRCNPGLLIEFAKSIQNIFSRIDIHAMDVRSELFLSSVITLIPYCYPNLGDRFVIPAKNEHGGYQNYQFIVSDIVTLSIDASLSPMKAYGLKSELGHNILVFLGTTFPSAEGFLNALITDFTPFVSVGKIAFSLSRSNLQDYFLRNKNVLVYGKSLGGSFALHALREYESSIMEVHAVVPPGLHFWDGYKRHSDKKVTIITHAGDLVSKMGYFPEHDKSRIYEVSLTSIKITGVFAHVIAFPGSTCATVKIIDPKVENRLMQRHVLTAIHMTCSVILFSVLSVIFALHKTKSLVYKA